MTNPRPVGGQARHGASGGGGAREGDLDVMSATSSASGDVHASGSTASQNERRAQVPASFALVTVLMMMVAIVDYQDDFVFNKRNDDYFKRFTNK